ncbi:MAG: hypothetical protein OHK0012_10520 [Synechococcales cyanobacterium]
MKWLRTGGSAAAGDGPWHHLESQRGRWLQLWAGLRHIRLQDWTTYTEVGFRDPALTGQWIGLISSLPPAVSRCIHLTFTRSGWRTQGSLRAKVRVIWLLIWGMRWCVGQAIHRRAADPGKAE